MSVYLWAAISIWVGGVCFGAGCLAGQRFEKNEWKEYCVIIAWPIFSAVGVLYLLAQLPFREVRKFKTSLRDRETLRQFREWQASTKNPARTDGGDDA